MTEGSSHLDQAAGAEMITLREYFQRETEKVYAGLRIWWSSNRHSGALSWRSLLLEPACGDTTPLLLPSVKHQPVIEDADIIHSSCYQNLCSVPHNSSVRVSTAPHLHHSSLLHLPSLCYAISETLPSPFQRIWLSPLLFLQRVTPMPSILFQRVWSMPSSFPRRFRPRLRLPPSKQAPRHRLLLSVPKPRILRCPSPLFQRPPVVNSGKLVFQTHSRNFSSSCSSLVCCFYCRLPWRIRHHHHHLHP
ncbi:hypothetical protein ILYODFUR_000107 [Ilyodon furcidens]|uniref:Uncharacterized protein n=1 Tax=Ilyodon furcidens TaxID=33524 RepID=A0ABV0TIS5_9TELE